MSDLTVDGDSNYTSTGTPDTFTPPSNGPSGSDVVAEHIAGVCRAVTEMQALLGNALTLKGTVADLVTRLSRVIHEDGAIAKGTSFPGTPINGQPFYRTDHKVLYIYDLPTTSWVVGIDTGEFLKIDGTRNMVGDITIRKAIPALRLIGLEGSAKDVQIREDAGFLVFYNNTGSEEAPTWTEFMRVTPTTGELQTLLATLTGSGNFRSIFTHANTADRTYTLPNNDYTIEAGVRYKGPTSAGSGSTRSHEGAVTISGNQALTGTHFYTDFVLDAGVTITPAAASRRLIIIASQTITINGTIAANAIGAAGGATAAFHGNAGADSTDQPGGAGGAGTGVGGTAGACAVDGATFGTTQRTGSDVPLLSDPLASIGGAGGGSGSGNNVGGSGGAGGRGGGTVILIAPAVVLAATATINTSGGNGSNGGAANCGGGGGGGGGNFYVLARTFTDAGATLTLSGGTGGSAGGAGGSAGTAGSSGVKQINLYNS